MSNLYNQRGVSADKEDVHQAIRNLDHGLFPKAFCKIYPDYVAGNDQYVNILHADGAGTKSVLAYLYWKETGDLNVWKGIAQDALVMNLDDLLCVGATGPFIYSSTIGRNKSVITGDVIEAIISGSQEFMDMMNQFGVEIRFLGGETADVGDVVRTILVDGTMMARMKKENVIDSQRIEPGDVIVSLASYGQATYEPEYNSGIGSNGLTSARHDLLKKEYLKRYPESVDEHLDEAVVFNGPYSLNDSSDEAENIGKLILSPTRTYAPVLIPVIREQKKNIKAIIHCSGGGQTKCLHYIPDDVRIIKNNLLGVPEIFTRIQKTVDTDWKEMYKVFNMGQRMEIFTDEITAQKIIDQSKSFNIAAQVSGHVEKGTKELIISSPYGEFRYT